MPGTVWALHQESHGHAEQGRGVAILDLGAIEEVVGAAPTVATLGSLDGD